MDSRRDCFDESSNVFILIPRKANGRGTCAMKPREKGGVVDKDLNVHLTTNLKIAGMSWLNTSNDRHVHYTWLGWS